MSRLIAFGCSFTFGDGLPDCWDHRSKFAGEFHSILSWPNKLGALLEIPIVNVSEPGASNKQIWNSIVNFKFQNDDIVVVLWTNLERHCLIGNNNKITKFGNWDKTGLSKKYFKMFYDYHNLKNNFHLCSNHCKFYLDSLNIKNYHLTSQKKHIEDMPKWNIVNFLPIFMNHFREIFPLALDGSHPGVEAHAAFAEKLYSLIK